MTNEEKAKEICRCSVCTYKINSACTYKKKRESDNCMCPKMAAVLQAMELKDKEWADRFQKAFEGMWTASFSIDVLSSETKTTVEFQHVTRE